MERHDLGPSACEWQSSLVSRHQEERGIVIENMDISVNHDLAPSTGDPTDQKANNFDKGTIWSPQEMSTLDLARLANLGMPLTVVITAGQLASRVLRMS